MNPTIMSSYSDSSNEFNGEVESHYIKDSLSMLGETKIIYLNIRNNLIKFIFVYTENIYFKFGSPFNENQTNQTALFSTWCEKTVRACKNVECKSALKAISAYDE